MHVLIWESELSRWSMSYAAYRHLWTCKRCSHGESSSAFVILHQGYIFWGNLCFHSHVLSLLQATEQSEVQKSFGINIIRVRTWQALKCWAVQAGLVWHATHFPHCVEVGGHRALFWGRVCLSNSGTASFAKLLVPRTQRISDWHGTTASMIAPLPQPLERVHDNTVHIALGEDAKWWVTICFCHSLAWMVELSKVLVGLDSANIHSQKEYRIIHASVNHCLNSRDTTD